MKEKLSKKQYEKYLNFLNANKILVGLSDWTIVLEKKIKVDDGHASVEPDVMEKKLIVKIHTLFFDQAKELHENILFHELVHGRIQVHNEHVEQYVNISEEHLANDITRGFEKLLPWGLKK